MADETLSAKLGKMQVEEKEAWASKLDKKAVALRAHIADMKREVEAKQVELDALLNARTRVPDKET